MIPRLLHRIWLGGDAIPVESEEYWRRWRLLHPGWRCITWTDRWLWPLVNQAHYDAADSPAQRADILRLEILLRHGGVYVDVDFEPLRSIEPLVSDVACFLAREDGQWIATGIVGAEAGDPFIGFLVDRLPASVTQGGPVNEQTGPMFVTRSFWEWSALGRTCPTIFAPSSFYPYHFSRPADRDRHFPDAYAVHHWSGSWA